MDLFGLIVKAVVVEEEEAEPLLLSPLRIRLQEEQMVRLVSGSCIYKG